MRVYDCEIDSFFFTSYIFSQNETEEYHLEETWTWPSKPRGLPVYPNK